MRQQLQGGRRHGDAHANRHRAHRHSDPNGIDKCDTACNAVEYSLTDAVALSSADSAPHAIAYDDDAVADPFSDAQSASHCVAYSGSVFYSCLRSVTDFHAVAIADGGPDSDAFVDAGLAGDGHTRRHANAGRAVANGGS